MEISVAPFLHSVKMQICDTLKMYFKIYLSKQLLEWESTKPNVVMSSLGKG